MNALQSFPKLERPIVQETVHLDSEISIDKSTQTVRSFPQTVASYLWGVVVNLAEASRRWQRDDAGLLAACVAYYATISLFPLLMVLISGIGIFLRFTPIGQSSEQFLLTVIAQETTQEVATQVNSAFQQIEHQALLSGPLAMVGLIAAAVVVFAQFDKAFDKIWKVDSPRFNGYVSAARRAVLHRIKAFGVLFSLGCVIALMFFARLALDALILLSNDWLPVSEYIWIAAESIVSIVIDTLVFTAIYKGLSKIAVGWLHAARGGLLAALTWEVGRILLTAYLSVSNHSAYGVVGALMVAMLWSYYASSVLFLGAEYVQVIREHAHRNRQETVLQKAVDQHRKLTKTLPSDERRLSLRRVA